MFDIVTEFILSDIPAFAKDLDVLLDDRLDHLIQDIGNGLTAIAFWIVLYFLPKFSDDLGKIWIGLLKTLNIVIHGFPILSA